MVHVLGGPQEKVTGCARKCRASETSNAAYSTMYQLPSSNRDLRLFGFVAPRASETRSVLGEVVGRAPRASVASALWPVTLVCSLPNVFTGAINFLRSLLEPDPVKRPNIQQALANRWLNENYMGKVPYNVTYPNR